MTREKNTYAVTVSSGMRHTASHASRPSIQNRTGITHATSMTARPISTTSLARNTRRVSTSELARCTRSPVSAAS